jgi:hypothetical protein
MSYKRFPREGPAVAKAFALVAAVATGITLLAWYYSCKPFSSSCASLGAQLIKPEATQQTTLPRANRLKLFAGARKEPSLDPDVDGASTDVSPPYDFDHLAYLDYNPDVRAVLGETANRDTAVEHYMEYGYQEKRLYTRIPVVFT